MDLDKIKSVELEILKQTTQILTRHNITYYLSYGTLIGAVRHQGFIPWDDDIDISIFRKDYEKARRILIKELPPEYIYCDRFTEPNYPYNFGKVRLKKSAFVHGGDAHLDISHGIYIDLFPIDNCESNPNKRRAIFKKLKRLRTLHDLSIMSYKKYGKFRPIWQLPLIFICRHTYNARRLRERIDELCLSNSGENSDSEYVCSYLTPYGEKDVYPRIWFAKGVELEFEDSKFTAPSNYDSYLRHLYGDYMCLPPEDKRVSHHDVILTSLTKEYHPQ